MTIKISIAYSPDTDDAFMVHALKEKLIPWGDFEFSFEVGDIQVLNEEARHGRYDITAISVGAYPELQDQYFLMPVGASIGDQFGPAIVVRPSSLLGLDDLRGKRIAVPGLNTSAHVAAQALIGPFTPVPTYFLNIKDSVLSGAVDAGILIHELQLNPESQGLKKLSDLGRLWFERFQLPMPLGANAIKKDLGLDLIKRLSALYLQSVEYGLRHRRQTIASAIAVAAAKESLDAAMGDRYISMYVNERSLSFQSDVLAGIKTLFEQGARLGLLIPVQLNENICG